MTRFMKPAWLSFFILMFGLLTVAQTVSASTFTPISDDDLIISARAIVTGKVVAIESNYDEQQDRIYTYITVKVQQVLKGQISERRIVLKELGGQVGNRGLIVWGNPQFKRGERVLLYLDSWKDGSLRTYQLFLGKFNIVKDEATGHQYVQRGESNEGISMLRPQSLGDDSHRTYTDRMELNSYLQMVSERLAANLSRSAEFQQTYYGGVPLNARPAEYKKIAGSGDILPEWTYISGSHPRWFEPDSGQPVVFQVNPDQAPNPQILDDVTAAMNCWGSVPGTSLRIATGGTTSLCREGIGTNLILFNACDGRWAPSSGCSGTLALGGLGWTGNSIVIGGVTYLQATAGFISFNPYASCYFGDHCNVREITTHELGHAMGLGHSADSTATMYAYAHFDGRCASVMADDMAGITTIYPGSGGGGSPLSVTTASLPGGTVGTAYSATLAATGGTPPYSWSVVSGALPAGLSLNAATGAITGTPTTVATSSFTVQVRDSATTPATANKALSIAVTSSGGGGGGTYSSQFVSQNVPTTLTPGQAFTANLVWTNNGTATWDGSLGGLRLISQNPPNNTTWGGNTVLLTPFVVLPGQQLNVTFQAIAPTTAGTYNFQWIVASDAASPFGQQSTNVAIQVGSGGGGGGTNNAAFVSQTVPSTMTAGLATQVSLTFTNTGTTTWTPGTYVLSSMNPTGNLVWGTSQVALTSSVAPGSNATFTFNVTPPAIAGSYNFQWGMAQAGVATFGTPSTNVVVMVTGGTTAGNNAQFLSQSVPANWTPGQTYTISVSMKNTGTTTWSTLTYKLGSQSPANNTSWGPSRANLAKNVPPGSMGTFTFTVTAPTAPGTYNFQWQMIQEGGSFFGDMTTNKPLTVGGGGGGGTDGATFVSQNVPSTMTAGQSVAVSLTFSNSGTTTWSPGTYTLGSRSPDGNTTWGMSQVALANSVAPGGSAIINFNVTAPATAATYTFQWGMRQGSTYFGTSSPATSVSVTSGGGGGGGTNNAAFVSQTVPATLNVGQSSSVTVTMNNNGTTTWAAGTYSLQSQTGGTWSISRVNLAAPVAPGNNATFTFTITAPDTAATYNFQWRMAQDGVGVFGDLTTNVAIVVSAGGSVSPLSITTTSLPYGRRGVFYSVQLVATGGRQPYTWSYTGSLPAGVTLNTSTGLISGTPTAGGSFTISVTVRDPDGRSASRTYKTFFQ